MANRKVIVEFLGKDTSLSKTAQSAGNNTEKLSKRMMMVGKVGGLALAAGLIGAGKAMVGMTKNAIEDEASQRKLAVALKNTTNASKAQVAGVEKWIAKQGRALGVTDDELRPAFQRLAQATGDVGKAQKLAGIAMDASAGSGKSLKTVSEAIAKAQNGNMGALSRLGVKIKDADGKTLSFNEAMKEMGRTFEGQAAAKANTLEGKMDRLNLMWDEAKETIGGALIPVLTKFGNWFLNTGVPALSKFSNFMQQTFGPVFSKIKSIIDGAFGEGGGGTIGKWASQIIGIFRNVISIGKSLWSVFGGTITQIVTTTFANLKTVIGGALNVIAGIFKVISSVLKGDWSGAWAGIKQIVKGAWQIIKGIVSQGWNVIKGAFKLGGNAIKAIFGGIWKSVKSLAAKGISTLVSAIRAVPGKIKALGGKMKDAGKWILQKLFDGLKSAGGMAGKVASAVWSAVKRLLNGLISSLNRKIPDRIGPFDLPNNPIPRLAKGGIVKARPGGTLALVGEAGQDEAVIPLGRGKNSSRVQFRDSAASGGDTYIFNISGVIGNKDEVARAIRQELLRHKRLTGAQLGLA